VVEVAQAGGEVLVAAVAVQAVIKHLPTLLLFLLQPDRPID
jgi:hypothetical protein